MAESQGGFGSSGTRRSICAGAAKWTMAGATQEVSVPCGACKHLKRKCIDGCIFAPYFGTDQGLASFAAVHKVFGASNVTKLLSNILPNRRQEAMETIIYEAQARISNPVSGCVSTIIELQQKVEAMQAEMSMMKTQLMNNGFAYENGLQTTHQQHQQMLQQPNFNVSVQPAYSNNSTASMNNFNPGFDFTIHTASTSKPMNMNNFNPGFDPTMETAPSSQSLEPFQNFRFSYYPEDD